MSSLRALWAYLARLARLARRRPPAPPASNPVEAKRDPADVEMHGGWYFKRHLLDELDDYFDKFAYLKKGYPEAYAVFRRVGVTVGSLGKNRLFNIGGGVPARWCIPGERPSMGAVTIFSQKSPSLPATNSKGEEWCLPKFGIFFRFKRQVLDVATRPGEDTFFVVQYIAQKTPKGKKLRFPLHFYISMDRDGNLTLLRELVRKNRKIRPKKGGYTFQVPDASWRYPEALKSFYADRPKEYREQSIEEYAAGLFRMIIHAFENSGAVGVRVTVSKGAIAGAFYIDMLRTPHFFADRDVTISRHGKRARIFHIVRVHTRRLADGREVPVRTHFRGLRKFKWNGYDVNITLPGYHHSDPLRLDAPAYDMSFQRNVEILGDDVCSMKQVAKIIAKDMGR